MEGAITIRLLQFPVEVQFRASEHLDALQREFDLIRSGPEPGESVPGRLLDLIDELSRTYGGVGDRPGREIADARREGREVIDVTYELPPAAADASRRLDELLDEADAYCRGGTHLLTLATPPDARAFRKWFLGEVIGQIGGAEPTPWPDFRPEAIAAPADEPPAPVVDEVPLPPGWSLGQEGDVATLVVDEEIDLENASTLRDVVQELAASQLTDLVLDLSKVPFLDSVGVSVLIASRRRLDEVGTTLRIVPSAAVRRTLEVSDILDWLGAGD